MLLYYEINISKKVKFPEQIDEEKTSVRFHFFVFMILAIDNTLLSVATYQVVWKVEFFSSKTYETLNFSRDINVVCYKNK